MFHCPVICGGVFSLAGEGEGDQQETELNGEAKREEAADEKEKEEEETTGSGTDGGPDTTGSAACSVQHGQGLVTFRGQGAVLHNGGDSGRGMSSPPTPFSPSTSQCSLTVSVPHTAPGHPNSSSVSDTAAEGAAGKGSGGPAVSRVNEGQDLLPPTAGQRDADRAKTSKQAQEDTARQHAQPREKGFDDLSVISERTEPGDLREGSARFGPFGRDLDLRDEADHDMDHWLHCWTGSTPPDKVDQSKDTDPSVTGKTTTYPPRRSACEGESSRSQAQQERKQAWCG